MKTLRNGIEVSISSFDRDMSDQVDAIYEIADAVLNSDKTVYRRGMHILEKDPTSQKVIQAMSQLLLPHVEKIAIREGLESGVAEETFKAIADQIAKNFDDVRGADYRRAQTSGCSM